VGCVLAFGRYSCNGTEFTGPDSIRRSIAGISRAGFVLAGSLNNSDRAYNQVRNFIGNDGHDRQPAPLEPGLPPPAR
jgi:hypothetical protein